MIDQRRDATLVVRANAEDLPFVEKQFDVAMAVLTVHHWRDKHRGLMEMQRVSHRQVILTFDPTMADSLWLVRDYLPEFAAFDKQRALTIQAYRETLGSCQVLPVFVPWDCTDGFLAAYWRRPARYLELHARNVISSFAQLPEATVLAAISRLESDIGSGVWTRRNAELLDRDSMDFGYRLIVAGRALTDVDTCEIDRK